MAQLASQDLQDPNKLDSKLGPSVAIFAQYLHNICTIFAQYLYNICTIFVMYLQNTMSIFVSLLEQFLQYLLNICLLVLILVSTDTGTDNVTGNDNDRYLY